MKVKMLVTIFLIAFLSVMPTQKSHAIIWTVIKEALVKAIRAMDLAVQRVQNQTIRLQNAQRALENAMSKLKLDEISQWGAKQKELFNTYYAELKKVKAVIAHYKRVKQVIGLQGQLVNEYKSAMHLFRKDMHFRPQDLENMGRVYTGMVTQSLDNLDRMLLVVNSFNLQMNDAKRLQIIDEVSGQITRQLADLRSFTNQNKIYSLQRVKSAQELSSLKALYGLPE